jgi:hypothetical protein
MTYQGIVYIGNEIRFVLNTSRQVNLAAQNASLAARRAGNARGFQAVSSELKTFSQELAKAMGEMSVDILAIAEGVSSGYRELRLLRQFETANRLSGDGTVLTDVLLHVGRRRSNNSAVLAERMQRLGLQLTRSMRLCSNGRALARSAMIEATCGGESEDMLRNVAHDIERTIEDIHVRLKTIGTRLNNEQGHSEQY